MYYLAHASCIDFLVQVSENRSDFNYSIVVETVWWKIVFDDNIQWNLIGYHCT